MEILSPSFKDRKTMAQKVYLTWPRSYGAEPGKKGTNVLNPGPLLGPEEHLSSGNELKRQERSNKVIMGH